MADKTTSENIIIVKNLSKKFNGLKAVDNISFTVSRGDTFAFLGPNGAGKTTTVKLLTTLLRPDSGEIRINGYDPVAEPYRARSSFGIVFQDQSLDDELTGYENMEYHGVLYHLPKALRREQIEKLLKFVGLWDRKDDYVKKYSGGMRRRLEIARGLIHTPKVLFLDEPTVGLDPQTRNSIWTHINDMNKNEGVTVFLTTHYMDEADRVADRIAIIDQGKIIATGTPAGLKGQTGRATLEDAYLAITGNQIRPEEAGANDRMRLHRKLWHR